MTKEQYEKLKQLSIIMGTSITATAVSVACLFGLTAKMAGTLENRDAQKEKLIEDLWAMEESAEYRNSLEEEFDALGVALREDRISAREFTKRIEELNCEENIYDWAKKNSYKNEVLHNRMEEFEEVDSDAKGGYAACSLGLLASIFMGGANLHILSEALNDRKKLKKQLKKEENDKERDM